MPVQPVRYSTVISSGTSMQSRITESVAGSRPGAGSRDAEPHPAPARRSGSRGMPRAEREAQILDVAGVAFGRGDYHSASMDEIAELAGVSKPMLYAYFGSKEGLYVAYIARTGRELRDRLLRAGLAAAGADGEERIRRPVVEFLAFVQELKEGWRVLFREVASEPVAVEVAELREQIAQGIQRLLEGAPNEDASSPGRDPEPGGAPALVPGGALDGIAHAIVGAGEALANWWLEHPDVPLSEVADWFTRLVEAAVGSAAAAGAGAARARRRGAV